MKRHRPVTQHASLTILDDKEIPHFVHQPISITITSPRPETTSLLGPEAPQVLSITCIENLEQRLLELFNLGLRALPWRGKRHPCRSYLLSQASRRQMGWNQRLGATLMSASCQGRNQEPWGPEPLTPGTTRKCR